VPPFPPSTIEMEGMYQPLDPSRLELRRLTLSPAGFDDNLYGTLDIVSLNDRPNYDALSYVWGEDLARTPMIIGGTEISITPNLDDALRHLRHRLLTRSIWVDAICIDQKNLVERADQVKFMRQIYRQASRTLVWLGSSGNDSDIAMRSIQNLDEKYWQTYEFEIQFMEILYRPWFTRIWVVQEFVLGKNPRIGCGNLWVHWVSFIKAWAICGMKAGPISMEHKKRLQEAIVETFQPSWIEKHIQKTIELEDVAKQNILKILDYAFGADSLQRIGFSSMHELLQDIQNNVARWSARYDYMKHNQYDSPIAKLLERKWKLGKIIPLTYCDFLYHCRDTLLTRESLTLVEVLKGTMNLRSKDARDKIYGILGLISEQARDEIPVDYQMKPEWSFLPTTEYIIKNEPGGLPMLGLLWNFRRFEGSLPSWVIDFTISADWQDEHSPVFLRGSCLNATWKWSQNAEILNNHTTLSASGFSFGKVKELFFFSNGDFQTRMNQLQEVESLVMRECPLNEPLWRTLIGVHNTGSEALDSELPFGERFTLLMSKADSQLNSIASFALVHKMFQDSILPTIRGRKFFITDLGYAGISTPQIEKGDTIALIFDMTRAVVLRQANPNELGVKIESADQDACFHRIAGFAYVGCHDRDEFQQLEEDGLLDWKQHFCFRDKKMMKFYII
jgi:Heterokaryon incompatibility protein (HET)